MESCPSSEVIRVHRFNVRHRVCHKVNRCEDIGGIHHVFCFDLSQAVSVACDQNRCFIKAETKQTRRAW